MKTLKTDGKFIPTIKLSEVNRLEKRIGARIWNGVVYNRDGITNPTLTILANDEGREILEILKLERSAQ